MPDHHFETLSIALPARPVVYFEYTFFRRRHNENYNRRS